MPDLVVFRTCPGCRLPFTPHHAKQRWCSERCKPARLRASHNWRSARPRGTTTERGYGHDHEQRRRQALADLKRNPGQPCCRCHQPMWPDQRLHLDHTQDRTGYLGLAHARCNLTAAAREGNRRKQAKRTTSRAW